METKANYVVVGIFTLVAVLAAFGFVYWTAAIGDRGETSILRVRIPGSASGLGRGSAVLFNGVKVGDVQRVFIDAQNPGNAIADTEIDRLTPITQSTQADIGLAGLTGQANIELRGGDLAEPRLIDQAESEGRLAEITANPSAVTNLLQTAQDIFRRADSTITQLEGFVAEARGPLGDTLQNVETFSNALARNSQGVDTFLASVASLSDELAGVSGRVDSTLQAAESLLRSVEPDQVRAIVSNVEGITADLRQTSTNLDRVVAGVDTTLSSFSTLAVNSQAAVGRATALLESVDPQAVRNSVANIERATGTANEALATLSDVSRRASTALTTAEGLLASVDQAQVRQIVGNVEGITANLRETSANLDRVIAGVDTALSSYSALATNAQAVVGRVTTIVEGVDPESVRTSIANIEQGTRTANEALTTLRDVSQGASNVLQDIQRVARTVGGRTEEIDQAIVDASQLATRLNAAAVRVDGVLQKVDGLLGSDETEGLIVDAGATFRSFRETADSLNRLVSSPQAQGLAGTADETLRAFRQVATTLNGRIGPITDGLARFSGQGLQSVEELVRTTGQSINRIERSITDLSQNPQRILSGGEGEVRRYDGRARR